MYRIATVIKPLMPKVSVFVGLFTATLLAVYCWLQLGDMQMTSTPVIILPDLKVVIASLFLAIAGVLSLKLKKKRNPKLMM